MVVATSMAPTPGTLLTSAAASGRARPQRSCISAACNMERKPTSGRSRAGCKVVRARRKTTADNETTVADGSRPSSVVQSRVGSKPKRQQLAQSRAGHDIFSEEPSNQLVPPRMADMYGAVQGGLQSSESTAGMLQGGSRPLLRDLSNQLMSPGMADMPGAVQGGLRSPDSTAGTVQGGSGGLFERGVAAKDGVHA